MTVRTYFRIYGACWGKLDFSGYKRSVVKFFVEPGSSESREPRSGCVNEPGGKEGCSETARWGQSSKGATGHHAECCASKSNARPSNALGFLNLAEILSLGSVSKNTEFIERL